MELPNVDNIATNAARNITINVKADRKLTEAELTEAIRFYQATEAGQNMKDNSSYTIFSAMD